MQEISMTKFFTNFYVSRDTWQIVLEVIEIEA